MASDTAWREAVARLLDWEEAHGGFDAAVAGLAEPLRGRAPTGLPYSPWQLLEHLRIAQRDLLDFCRDPNYQAPKWPDDYWPSSAEPPNAGAWDESVRRFREDRAALQALARDRAIDLTARIPHGDGQTYLRTLL